MGFEAGVFGGAGIQIVLGCVSERMGKRAVKVGMLTRLGGYIQYQCRGRIFVRRDWPFGASV